MGNLRVEPLDGVGGRRGDDDLVGDAVSCCDGLLWLAQRAAEQELDDDLLLRVAVFALALVGAASPFPLLVLFVAELVFALAVVLAAQLGIVFPVLLTLLVVPQPVLLPTGVVAPAVRPGNVDSDDDRGDSCRGQHESGNRSEGCPLQEAEPEEGRARVRMRGGCCQVYSRSSGHIWPHGWRGPVQM